MSEIPPVKLLILLFIYSLTPLCLAAEQPISTLRLQSTGAETDSFDSPTESKQKLFFVNSYHKGYLWSDNIENGLLQTLGIKINLDGSFDISQNNVQLKIFRMDTKLTNL